MTTLERTPSGPPVPPATAPRAAAPPGARRAPAWAPPVALAVGIVVLAAAAAAVNVRITAWVLDETIIKSSAVHYTHGLPGSLFHDLSARGTARLYSLLLAPIFALFDGDVGVRVARALNALLFASAAIPVYLLAGDVLVSRWRAVAAALLGAVAVPWFLLSSALYTENLAWPLYFWAILAMLAALRRPSPWRDLAAVAVVAACTCTRVQLASLLAAYLALVLWRERAALFARRTRGPRPALGALRRFPVLGMLAVAGLVVLVSQIASGQLHATVQHVLGSYSEFQDRTTWPANTVQAALIEVLLLGVGIGVLPAVAGLAWYTRALRRSAPPAHRELALVTAVAALALVVLVVYAQGGYLGGRTEERYFMYLAPPLWVGAFAVLEARQVRATALAVAGWGTALAAICGAIALLRALDVQTIFLSPVQDVLTWWIPRRLHGAGIDGVTVADALAYAVLLATALAVLAWRRPGLRAPVVVGIGAAVQLAIAGYGWALSDGASPPAGSRVASPPTFAQLGWLDRATPPGARPVYVNDLVGLTTPMLLAAQRALVLYNDDVAAYATVPALGRALPAPPLTAVPAVPYRLDPATGRLTGRSAPRLVVDHPNSPSLQLAGGDPIAASPDHALQLRRVSLPLRATWTAVGLPPEGWLVAGAKVPLRLYPGAVAGRAAEVRMVVAPVSAAGPTAATIVFAGQRREVKLPVGLPPITVSFRVCLGRRPIVGEVVPEQVAAGPPGAPMVAGSLSQVQIAPAPSC